MSIEAEDPVRAALADCRAAHDGDLPASVLDAAQQILNLRGAWPKDPKHPLHPLQRAARLAQLASRYDMSPSLRRRAMWLARIWRAEAQRIIDDDLVLASLRSQDYTLDAEAW